MTTIILPWPSPYLSPNASVHWSVKAKAKKQYKALCWATTLERKVVADWDGPVYLGIVFLPPNRHTRDLDNCIASMKSGLDGVAAALGIDDSRFKFSPTPELSADVAGKVWVTVSRTP